MKAKPVRLLVIGDPHGAKELLKLDTRGYDAAIVTGDFGKSDIMRKLTFGTMKPTKYAERDLHVEYVNSALPVLRHISKGLPTFCVKGNAEVSDDGIRAVNKKFHCKIPLFESEIARMKNLIILNHAVAKFRGLKIAGIGHFLETRWVQEFSEASIEKMILAAIEEEIARIFFANVGRVDIMITHQPPYGVMDVIKEKFVPKKWHGRHAGSVLLLEYIKKYHPRYVICGHIHEGKGTKKVGRTTVINAGCCGDRQKVAIKPLSVR